MKQIPNAQNHMWTQQNTSDVLGDIFASKNLDLTENLGKLRLGRRMVLNTSTLDTGNFSGTPVAFAQWNPTNAQAIFMLAGSNCVQLSDNYPAAAPYSYTNVGTNFSPDVSDMIVYNGNLYATTETALVEFASGTWTPVGSALATGTAHMMCVYNGLLYVTNLQSQVWSWNGSTMNTSGGQAIQLGSSLFNIITCIRAASNRIWISTVNSSGGRGYVYEWDGASTTVSVSHVLESAGALSCVVKDDIPYIMDVYGCLIAWNGSTFIEQARLYRRTDKLFYNSLSTINNRFIHPNGLAIVKNRINALIDTRHDDPNFEVEQTIPSGVWEYDETIGIYHKHSLTRNHVTDTITDYGASRISRAGAIMEVNGANNTTSARNGTFITGADYFLDASATTSGVFYDDSNDTLQKAGHFITTKIEATDGSPYNLPTVQAQWNSFVTMYRLLLNATDKIVPKYRTNDVETVDATITWVTSNQFTVPNTSVNAGTYYLNGQGNEVEIIQGIGASMCAHITAATLAGGTWTVTLDENIPNATGTSIGRFGNWVKISEITPLNNPVNFNSDTIGIPSTWVQFKVWMLFTGKDEIERILISNGNATPVK
jgi:hypothetical protein